MTFKPEETEEQHDDMLDDYELDYIKWDGYIKFEPLGKDELYLIMEGFVSDLDDEQLSEVLELALNDNNPIEAFKKAIDNCDARNKWIDYKHQKTIEHVQQILLNDPRMR